MNVGCHAHATPHVVGQVFVTDNAEGGTLVDACDGRIIKPCLNCPEQPRAYHTYKDFKVFYNTNRPFEQVVSNFALNIINCSNFADFTMSSFQFNGAIAADDLCDYGNAQGLAPFSVKIRNTGPSGVSGPSILAFNFPDDCSSIPSTPLDIDGNYTVFINGLDCGIRFQGPTALVADFNICLSTFEFFTTTTTMTYQDLAQAICVHIQDECDALQGNDIIVTLVDPANVVTTLVDLNGGCDTSTDTTNFTLGATYEIRINGAFAYGFTVTS